MENLKIADLHCDLLSYLHRNTSRTPFDNAVRCSIPQLIAGKVSVQTLAIFAENGPDSSKIGWEQVLLFKKLPEITGGQIKFFNKESPQSGIHIIPAIENFSALCSEEDHLDQGFSKLDTLHTTFANVVYLSLTWNYENRFGGGALTSIGLKQDGRHCLDFINGKKIALDLSHASDQLAFEALNYIDANNLDIPILASHSNCRMIVDLPRNLPEPLIKEIIHRSGLIGLNFYKPFIGGDTAAFLLRHLDYLLDIGGQDAVCFGADFFYEKDFNSIFSAPEDEKYYPGLDSSACYPFLYEMICSSFSREIAEKVSSKNFFAFAWPLPSCSLVHSKV